MTVRLVLEYWCDCGCGGFFLACEDFWDISRKLLFFEGQLAWYGHFVSDALSQGQRLENIFHVGEDRRTRRGSMVEAEARARGQSTKYIKC